MFERRRVAVTGIGAVTPIGSGRERLWSGLRAERSAVGRLTCRALMQRPCRRLRRAGHGRVPSHFFKRQESIGVDARDERHSEHRAD